MLYRLFLLFFLLLVNMNCFAQEQRAKLTNADTNQYSIYRPSLKFTKVNTDSLIIARLLFEKYLDHYRGKNIIKTKRIKNYKIGGINFVKGDSAGFTFTVIYSVHCIKESYIEWRAGNGRIGNNYWIINKSVFVDVIKEKEKYTVKEIYTGP